MRFRFLSWLGASGPRLMIDRDSCKRLLDGVQHARKRKHRLRFFTVQQQESNRLKTECRQDMDGWLVSGEPTVGLAVRPDMEYCRVVSDNGSYQ